MPVFHTNVSWRGGLKTWDTKNAGMSSFLMFHIIPSPVHTKHPCSKPWVFCREFPHQIGQRWGVFCMNGGRDELLYSGMLTVQCWCPMLVSHNISYKHIAKKIRKNLTAKKKDPEMCHQGKEHRTAQQTPEQKKALCKQKENPWLTPQQWLLNIP